MKRPFKRARIIAVVVVAPALGIAVPVIPPVLAQEAACTTWTAEMVEDEGGEVLTAQSCATDNPDAYITITCGSGTAGVRIDLAAGSEAAPQSNETTDVTFATSTDKVTVNMAYEEYDGYFATYPKPDDPLIQLIKAGDSLTVSDVPEHYPAKHFSLKGSSAALGKLVANCG
jgi:hypothetical protein